MNKAEAKFRNTTKKMHSALFRLLETYDFEKISVAQLCKEAGINRSTFYSHYTTTAELLKDTHSTLMQELFESFQARDLISCTLLESQQSNFVHEKFLIPYLEFVKANKKQIKVYMKHIDLFKQAKASEFWFKQISTAAFNARGISDPTTIDYMYKFYLIGCNAILMQWLEGDCKESVRFIAEVVTKCIRSYKR